MVHQGLESSWGIGKAKGHYQELTVALMGSEGSFQYVFWAHLNLVIASS